MAKRRVPTWKWLHQKLREIRKAIFFGAAHTGTEPPANADRWKFKTRVRQQVRKKLGRFAHWFPLFHTGAVPLGSILLVRTKMRKVKPRTKTRLARWSQLFHFSPVQVDNVNVVKMSVRKAPRKRKIKRALFFSLAHFTLAPTPFMIPALLALRVRRVHSRVKSAKIGRAYGLYHTGATPVVGAHRIDWVSPQVSHSRGDQ